MPISVLRFEPQSQPTREQLDKHMSALCQGCNGSSSSHTCGATKSRKRKKADDDNNKGTKRHKTSDAEIQAALEWLTCGDLSEIKRGEGATQQSVKLITNNEELLQNPVPMLELYNSSGRKSRSAEELRQLWHTDQIRTTLLDSKNEATRRKFLNVVKRVRAEQTERQEQAASASKAKREEKKRLAAIERAERQARRDRLHKFLSTSPTVTLAICPVVSWFRNWARFSSPTTQDKDTIILEAKLKDRAAIGKHFRSTDENRSFEFVFDPTKVNVRHQDGSSSERKLQSATLFMISAHPDSILNRYEFDDLFSVYVLPGLMFKRAARPLIIDSTTLVSDLASIVLGYWMADTEI